MSEIAAGARPLRRAGSVARVAVACLLVTFLVGGCGWGVRDGVERGTASWYGGKFHGRRTASGEVFDRRALTAAHPSLPFGARVRVTVPESGRAVVVRINDRSSGARGRIIDLSEAAFARIAPLDRGLVEVTVERLD